MDENDTCRPRFSSDDEPEERKKSEEPINSMDSEEVGEQVIIKTGTVEISLTSHVKDIDHLSELMLKLYNKFCNGNGKRGGDYVG